MQRDNPPSRPREEEELYRGEDLKKKVGSLAVSLKRTDL
jgi:hypothetical protein